MKIFLRTPCLGILLLALVPLSSFGADWEYRSDRGLLARATLYGLIGSSFLPWVGGSFGYAF
jgi:hypothetical protein